MICRGVGAGCRSGRSSGLYTRRMSDPQACPECGRRISERLVHEVDGPIITDRIDRYLQRATCGGCSAELERQHLGDPWRVRAG